MTSDPADHRLFTSLTAASANLRRAQSDGLEHIAERVDAIINALQRAADDSSIVDSLNGGLSTADHLLGVTTHAADRGSDETTASLVSADLADLDARYRWAFAIAIHPEQPREETAGANGRVDAGAIADRHGKEFDRHRRTMRIYHASTALLLSGLSAAVFLVLLWDLMADAQTAYLVAAAGIALIVFIAMVYTTRVADKHRRYAEESKRSQNQILDLVDYAPGVAPPLREVVLGVALQRFLARSFEDNDPYRDPDWPAGSSLESAFGSIVGDHGVGGGVD